MNIVSEARRRSLPEVKNAHSHHDHANHSHNNDCLQTVQNEENTSVEKNGTLQMQEVKTKSKFSRKQISILVIVIYGNFWLAACYSLLAPFFPKEAEKKNMSPTVYGLVFGTFQLVIFITSPIYGKLMPKYIAPSFLLNGGIFVSAICSVLFGLLEYSPPDEVYAALAFIIRIIEAVGVSAYFGSSWVIIIKEFPENRATILSVIETTYGLGMIVGPTIGGALYQLGGFMLPFVVIGGILIIGATATYFIMPAEEECITEERGSFFKLLFHLSVLVDILLYLTSLIGMGFNEATLEPHLRKFNLQPVVLGTIFVAFGALYALAAPVWGYCCDRVKHPRYLTLIGGVQCMVAYLLIGPAPFMPFDTKLWLVILAQVLLGFGLGAKIVCAFIQSLKDAVAHGFPDDVSTYAMVTSVFITVLSLGGFIGPSLGGFLLEHIGYEKGTMVLLAFEVLVALAIVLFAAWEYRKQKTKSEDSASSVPEDPEKQSEKSYKGDENYI